MPSCGLLALSLASVPIGRLNGRSQWIFAGPARFSLEV